jgi:DNA polymerase, archaea type
VEGWFIDAWRSQDAIVCWIKTQDADITVPYPQRMIIYAAPYLSLIRYLEQQRVPYERVTRRCIEGERRLIAIPAPITGYEGFVRTLERAGSYRTLLYDADITPESRFLIEHELYMGCPIGYDETSIRAIAGESVGLRVKRYRFGLEGSRITSVREDANASGCEADVLSAFLKSFGDPDVLAIDRSIIALLDERLHAHGHASPLHRFDPTPIRYREGRSLHRYGSVEWREASVHLRGRLVFEGDPEALVELSRISNAPPTLISTRSPGAVFQHAIVREMIRDGLVIAHKHKPLSEPLTMTQLIGSDRAGLSFDPLPGFHRNVIELDFTSMYPHLMREHSISAENLKRGIQAPGTPLRCDRAPSIISRAITPFLELRTRYKHGNESERERAALLKGVLVSANGYLRFREFKLGVPTSHMVLAAWARETLLRAKEIAEEEYRLIGGIIDSLYLTGSEDKIGALRARIERETRVPIEQEGTFRWIVFLTSRTNERRPVLTRYFGAFTDGRIKLRGIEARQRSTPRICTLIQHALIEDLARYDTYDQIRMRIPALVRGVRSIIDRIGEMDPILLERTIVLSKRSYGPSLHGEVLRAARRAGAPCKPGQRIRFIHTPHGIRMRGSGCTRTYQRLIERAVSTITTPFGYPRSTIPGLFESPIEPVDLSSILTEPRLR